MKSAIPNLLLCFLLLAASAYAQQSELPVDPVPVAFVREWLLEAGVTIPFHGPISSQSYRSVGVPLQHLHLGHRITREIWFLAAYDHYSEVRESIGPCPDQTVPCSDTFTDDFRYHAITLNMRWTFARSPNVDAFVGAGVGAADVWRYSAHLFKLIAPAELGIKGWVRRGEQFQWGPVIRARTIFGLDTQDRVSGGAMISSPMLTGLSFGMFARW